MRSRITYANVAATLALVFAMGGGAMAANQYLVSSTKQIDPKVLRKLKGKTGASGKTGLPGASGPQGPGGNEGPQGKEGPQGPAGTARAYARVTSAPVVTIGLNIASVTRPTTGIYCITTSNGLNRTNAVSVADPDYSDGPTAGGDTAQVVNGATFSNCPAHTSFEVRMSDSANALKNEGFTFIVG